jgi:hypothetical protein
MSTKALAERLGITLQALTRYRSKPDFIAWIQNRDPEGLVWIYDQQTKVFHPQHPYKFHTAPEWDVRA